jgi:hypothetical protein
MKCWIPIAGGLAGLAVAMVWQIAPLSEWRSGRPAGANLLHAEEVIDLGEVPRATTLDVTIPIANSSADRTVHIFKIRTSCGCMVATDDEIMFAPSEKRAIEIRSDTAMGPGASSNVVTLLATDGSSLEIRVRMKSVDPFPAVALLNEGNVSLALRDVYRGTALQILAAYTGASDEPLDAHFDVESGVLTLRALSPGDRVEVVFTMLGAVDEKLSQHIEIHDSVARSET